MESILGSLIYGNYQLFLLRGLENRRPPCRVLIETGLILGEPAGASRLVAMV